uniref:hypothetical protein n=1 Tax=Trametes maxima TaxID=259368 RepID=UPI0030027605|nr:hypothetical protein [Trametes maxima]
MLQFTPFYLLNQLYFNNKSVSPIRNIHTSLHVENKPQSNLNLECPSELDYDSLLKGLDKLKSIKDSTPSSVIVSYTEFQEMLTDFMTDDKIKNFFENKNLFDTIKVAVFKSLDKISPEMKEIIKNMPGETQYEKYIGYLAEKLNKVDSPEVEVPTIIKEDIALINKEYYSIVKPDLLISNIYQPIMQITEDGKFVLELSKIIELYLNLLLLKRTSANFDLIITGISQILIYKSVMNVYDRYTDNQLKKYHNEESRLRLTHRYAIRRHQFAIFGSVFIIAGLKDVFEFYKQAFPHKINVNINHNLAIDNKDKSFLFLVTFLKSNTKYVRLFVLAIIAVICYISFLNWGAVSYYFYLVINISSVYMKIFLIFMIFLSILSEIFMLYLLEKYSKLEKEPVLPKYLPSFIKKYFLNTYDISRMKEADQDRFISHTYITILLSIIFILFVILSIVIPIDIK